MCVCVCVCVFVCALPDLTDYFRAEKDRSQFASENNDLRAAMDHVSAEKVVYIHLLLGPPKHNWMLSIQVHDAA